jgi:hypothetical protein
VIFSFVSPNEIADAFHSGIMFNAVMVMPMAAVAALISLSEPIPLIRIKSIGILGIVIFSCLSGFTYSSTFGDFINAELSMTEIKLQYAGPFGGTMTLPLEKVENVLVGSGKTQYGCYIRIVHKSGKTYKSNYLYKQVETCRLMRQQILSARSS